MKLACFSTKLIADFPGLCFINLFIYLLAPRKGKKRENHPSNLDGWLFLSVFVYSSAPQPPCSLQMHLQAAEQGARTQAVPALSLSWLSILPPPWFKAISWVSATAIFASACFLHFCLHHARGQSSPWGSAALQLCGSQWAELKGLGTLQGLTRSTSQGPRLLQALQTEREDSFGFCWRYA